MRSKLSAASIALTLLACGGGHGTSSATGSGTGASSTGSATGATTGTGGAPGPPATTCIDPLTVVDTSKPTTVVGTRTAASCTEAALAAALAKGGVVTFDCGSAPATITVSAEQEIKEPAKGSPAIGAGTSGCPATDQRGMPRSSPCTLGAVEAG